MRILVAAELTLLKPSVWKTNEALLDTRKNRRIYVNELATMYETAPLVFERGMMLYGYCTSWKFSRRTEDLARSDKSALVPTKQRSIRERFCTAVHRELVRSPIVEIVASNCTLLRWCKHTIGEHPRVDYLQAFVPQFCDKSAYPRESMIPPNDLCVRHGYVAENWDREGEDGVLEMCAKVRIRFLAELMDHITVGDGNPHEFTRPYGRPDAVVPYVIQRRRRSKRKMVEETEN